MLPFNIISGNCRNIEGNSWVLYFLPSCENDGRGSCKDVSDRSTCWNTTDENINEKSIYQEKIDCKNNLPKNNSQLIEEQFIECHAISSSFRYVRLPWLTAELLTHYWSHF